MQSKHIAIVGGGDSSEYVVSIKSSSNILNQIDRTRFTPWMIRIRFDEWVVLDGDEIIAHVDKRDFSFEINQQRIKPAYAYIMIHGTPGEDGVLQGYFDLLKIPYSGCGVYASALTFHKYYCDNFLRAFNIKMADSRYFRKGDPIDPQQLAEAIGLPMFIKPSAGGSSFGVSKVKRVEDIPAAVEAAYHESGDCLVESFVDGMELAVGACRIDGKVLPFLPTEVIPKGEFFDYDSKYEVGGATEITPARIPDAQLKACQDLTVKIYELIGCKGIVRIDFILKNNEFYFLEVNTIPGMTQTSFIPQQLKAMGMNLSGVLAQIIENDL
ncbi:MAG: D-alanine--D-alanine ligase [Prolixibacteraceae bacterium]|nr:D-alanine--D-alanine ligase [Prolixibacteraceae bacterium]